MMNPELAPIIAACTPETDPGLYRRAQASGWEPPRDTRHDLDRTRIHDRDQLRRGAREAAARQNDIHGIGIDDVIHADVGDGFKASPA